MNNKIGLNIIIALVIGLLLGYIVYPFINQSVNDSGSGKGYKTSTTIDTSFFESSEHGITFEYPKAWQVDENTSVFEQGDVVTVYINGETQKPNTDFYDGGRFTVMTPLPTDDDLDTWVNSRVSANDQVSEVTIEGVVFKKVYTCGLGCSTYYYTVSNGKVYGINTFAEGSQKDNFQNDIEDILNSVIINQ